MATFTPLARRSMFLTHTPTTRVANLPSICKTNTECAICTEPITDDCEPVVLHSTDVFCKACITPWLSDNDSCPTCRRQVVSSLSYVSQRCRVRIDRIRNIDVGDIAEDLVLHDQGILSICRDLQEEFTRVQSLSRVIQDALLNADLEIELRWLAYEYDFLWGRREEMYVWAPQHVNWETYDFPSAWTRTLRQNDAMSIVSVSSRRSMAALRDSIEIEGRRLPRTIHSRRQVQFSLHPLFVAIETALRDAIVAAKGSLRTARSYYRRLLRAIDNEVPIISQRADRGHADGLVMRRLVMTLATDVVEAEMRHAQIVAQIEGPDGLVVRKYKVRASDDSESDDEGDDVDGSDGGDGEGNVEDESDSSDEDGDDEGENESSGNNESDIENADGSGSEYESAVE